MSNLQRNIWGSLFFKKSITSKIFQESSFDNLEFNRKISKT
jgi:hypothetical protein